MHSTLAPVHIPNRMCRIYDKNYRTEPALQKIDSDPNGLERIVEVDPFTVHFNPTHIAPVRPSRIACIACWRWPAVRFSSSASDTGSVSRTSCCRSMPPPSNCARRSSTGRSSAAPRGAVKLHLILDHHGPKPRCTIADGDRDNIGAVRHGHPFLPDGESFVHHCSGACCLPYPKALSMMRKTPSVGGATETVAFTPS